ncbi:hypothetical protein IW261DRAFT_1672266 [Armillaria novae-zelandiae]|uniref:DUF6535 domain-containing protein n=1 Tax=Armillaria novae-zelandiae TaxID=153914 RepID=A0AA39NSR0_9AGAR|nr:hypothetical protein IW261DRAFT_1672266 [Armillaria novae-zelandiae]
MSDQHRVDEVSSRHSSEDIPNVQDRLEGSSPTNSLKLPHVDEEKPKEMEIGNGSVNSDGVGVEGLLSPGIQEEASAEGDRGAEKSRPDPGLKTGNVPYNYEEKYPEDKIYAETAPNARVWRTYVDESKNHDARMAGESRDSVDVLLVFRTTFVGQTSQSLQADYAQVSASLLFEMVLIQRAVANGSSVDNVPVSSLNPSSNLATALVAVLVKQWLHHYLALPSGTPREQSHVRQYRYGGFQKWHVLVIIGLLPVLMHLALGIFFIGLTVFLVPLRPGFSWVIGVGTVVAYVTYLITVFLPILYPQYPYRTPLSDLVYFPCRYIKEDLFSKYVRPLFMKEVQRPNSTSHHRKAKISSLDDLERDMVQSESNTLSVEALHWLFESSSNPIVHGIVIQSVGSLPLSAMAAVKKVFGEAEHIRRAHDILLCGCTQSLEGDSWKLWPGMESKFERLLRFELFILHLSNDIYNELKFRSYVEAAANDWGLTVAIKSIDTLQRSKYKPPDTPTSTAFFRQVTQSHCPVMLPQSSGLGSCGRLKMTALSPRSTSTHWMIFL